MSTRPFARRLRTCFSWNPILRTFHVSPGKRGRLAGVGVGGNGGRGKGEPQAPARVKNDRSSNPGVGIHPVHLLLSLLHPQRLVQNRLARLTIIHHFNYPLRQGETTSVGISDEGDAPAADEDAASEGVRYAVIPEREVGLAMRLRLKMGWLGGPILT